MGIADRIFDALRATIQLNPRVAALGQDAPPPGEKDPKANS